MKGISTIIAVIILVVITIGLVSTAYLFMIGILTRTTAKVISLVHAKGHMAIIRNDGTDVIGMNDIRVIVNGKEVEVINPQNIDPHDSALLKFIPPDFGTDLRGAKIVLIGPSNVLNYVTDIIPNKLGVTSETMALWHFDEGSGYNITADCSGKIDRDYYNHGNMGNNDDPIVQDGMDPDWVSAKYGSALDFDRSNTDRIRVYDTSNLRLLINITVEAWIKTSTLEDSMTVSCRWDTTAPDHGGWIFYLNEGRITLNLTQDLNPLIGSEVVGTTDLRDGSWYHVLGTYDGSEIRVYVDGKLENSVSYSNGFDTSYYHLSPGDGHGVYIGLRCDTCTSVGGWYYDGVIDEVRIQNKSITQEEMIDSFYG